MKFYTYQLETADGEIFYIGKGSGNRMYKHIQIARGDSQNRKRNLKLYNKISSEIANGGFIISNVVFRSDDEKECHEKEIKLISEIGKSKLCNLTDGGEGTSGYTLSEEHKRKISSARKGIKRIFTEEHKRNISKAAKGRVSYWKGKKLPEETKRKMSISAKGKHSGPISDTHRQAIIDGIRRKKFEMNVGLK